MRDRAVAIVIHKKKLLVMWRKEHGKEYYTLPGGGVEANETAEEATLREIAEETSLKIKIDHILYIHHYENLQNQYYFFCEYIEGEPKLDINSPEYLNDKGEYKPMWIPIDELRTTLLYPIEIRDWIIEDYETGYKTIREVNLKISQLRQTI